MKKFKLLTILGGASVASISFAAPLSSCSKNEEEPVEPEVKTYSVKINKTFNIDKKTAEAGKELTLAVTWDDTTKVVDVEKAKIMVGDTMLTPRDFTYKDDDVGQAKGTLSIDRGIIDNDVTIDLALKDDPRDDDAPVSIVNTSISDRLRTGVNITCDKTSVTPGTQDDQTFVFSWNTLITGEIYYSNILTLSIGGRSVYQKSSTEPNGFIFTSYGEASVSVLVPSENFANITYRDEIIFTIELEVAAFDTLVESNTWASEYVYPTGHPNNWFDALHSGEDFDGVFAVSQNETIEFIVDLNKWNGGIGAIEGDIYFILGEKDSQTADTMTLIAPDINRAGYLYYGQKALSVGQETIFGLNVLSIHEPEQGWGDVGYRQPITGWYCFPEAHSFTQIMFLQESTD